MAAARVILVSDTHLSASAPQAQANWDAVVSYVDACAPDLVIHLGDLSFDGAHDAADLRLGRTQLDRLPAPWRAVSRQPRHRRHSPGALADSNVDAARRQRSVEHRRRADHWSVTVSGWMVLAVNAQLLGSGLDAEAAAVVVAGRTGWPASRPPAGCTHHP